MFYYSRGKLTDNLYCVEFLFDPLGQLFCTNYLQVMYVVERSIPIRCNGRILNIIPIGRSSRESEYKLAM